MEITFQPLELSILVIIVLVVQLMKLFFPRDKIIFKSKDGVSLVRAKDIYVYLVFIPSFLMAIGYSLIFEDFEGIKPFTQNMLMKTAIYSVSAIGSYSAIVKKFLKKKEGEDDTTESQIPMGKG
jgi:hypothetical protein